MDVSRNAELLPGEDPESSNSEDAIHWIAVYRDLLAVLERARAASPTLSDNGSDARMDHQMIRTQIQRYQARLEFWTRHTHASAEVTEDR